jgi:hypothetical protein
LPLGDQPELAPSGLGAVDDPAGEDVGEGVPEPDHQEHRADGGGADARHVGVVHEQEERRDGEREVVGCVTGAVTDHLQGSELHGGVLRESVSTR